MKLYYSPGACSLADHIALREAGIDFDYERVDLHARVTESGQDFLAINPKGYVPALHLDDGEMLTENVAVLDWIASRAPVLQVAGSLGRTRVLEMLTYITTEIHRAYKPLWHGGEGAQQAEARATISTLLQPIEAGLSNDYLFGVAPSVADFYLFVMLLWARKFEIELPDRLSQLRDRMMARDTVRTAMTVEGLHV
jgi:glutathione S-transferase